MGAELALVIFDCDGVLVDSEPVSNRALAAELAEAGWPIGYEETIRRFKGRSERDCLEEIRAHVPDLPDDFLARYQSRMYRGFAEELESVPGVRDALAAIDVPTCVASSGDHGKLERTLGKTGLYELFSGRIFSATEVARGKPHPDLFLHAAARMGAAPARCMVIEDSPLGVQAAHAAGMRALGFAGTELADARALRAAGAPVFSDMHALPGLLTGAA